MNRTDAAHCLYGAVLATLTCLPTTALHAAQAREANQRSLLLSAFGDATYGESRPFLANLRDPVDRSKDSVYCESVHEGMLNGQKVTVVVTGTGGNNAGPCAQEMLYWYASDIKEFIWSGIAGVSPAVGGLYAGDGRRRAGAEPVMIGDVCISPLTWNFDLTFSSVNGWMARRTPDTRYLSSGGWWIMKDADGQSKVDGFEDVQQYIRAPTALADELLAAAASETWPEPGPGVIRKIERFFERSRVRPVKVYDYTECAEVASNTFWHGATEDRLARHYLAGLINSAGFSMEESARPDTVVAYSGMESAAWMSVVARWNQRRNTSIPIVVVRSASNYDQMPLTADGDPVSGPNGKPLTAMQDILIDLKQAGAEFAANMAARPVLRMFRERQRRAARP